MTADTLPRLSYTRAEAAKLCGVSPDTLKRAVASGALRAKRTGPNGGKHLYTKAALEAWLDSLEDA